MTKTLAAIYENGVLRPLEPLKLRERQTVAVTISDSVGDIADAWLDHEHMAAADGIDESEPTLEEVHAALSSIPGDLSDDIRGERESRG